VKAGQNIAGVQVMLDLRLVSPELHPVVDAQLGCLSLQFCSAAISDQPYLNPFYAVSR